MAIVSYDQSSKVTCYSQRASNCKDLMLQTDTIGNIGCAMTSAGMCITKSPLTLYNDGFKTDECNWTAIANKYSKTTGTLTNPSLKTLATALKSYPAIVKVNGSSPHWVVVCTFSGDDANPTASDFTCYDPWETTPGRICLDQALRWSSVQVIRYMR